MNTEIYRLPGRAVISLTGADARPLLQRVITADVETLAPGQCRPGALLTPQGKIVCDFMIFPAAEGLLIDVEASAAEALKKRLSLYKLKADVALALREDLMPVWSQTRFAEAAEDPRLPGRIFRAVELARHCENKPLDEIEIAAGVPVFGRDYGEAEVFPTDVNLDAYTGVGWTKGCFIGQEVVSRMKRRGTIRKRSLPLRFQDTAPPAGTPVMAGSATLGNISAACGSHAVALIRLDRLAAAAEPPQAAGQSVTIDLPEALKPAPAPDKV